DPAAHAHRDPGARFAPTCIARQPGRPGAAGTGIAGRRAPGTPLPGTAQGHATLARQPDPAPTESQGDSRRARPATQLRSPAERRRTERAGVPRGHLADRPEGPATEARVPRPPDREHRP